MENKKPEIFLCTLTHDGKLDAGMSMVFNAGASKHLYTTKVVPSSLLAFTCNRMWCEAINEGYKWFAMLHADIVPELGFVDKLINLAEIFKADVMVLMASRARRSAGRMTSIVLHD